MKPDAKPNRLAAETSPYLLQHAYNPVDWFPWGTEALEKARKDDKPILVSIGYAACHWCHVMERESFEDMATARIMNEHFINIKIDREERPDLDYIYMDAVQAMTGSGGWPLNVFLTPDGKPFYGGTYFPPQRAYNRPSWQETLLSVKQAFRERRNEIDAQAENLTEHIRSSNSFGMQVSPEEVCVPDNLSVITTNLLKSADREWGGFGRAPKFPQTFSISYLLRYSHLVNAPDAEAARAQALLSLDKMINGGIYDQVGGGFARYATDTEWLVPHFEKMLYDNALLVMALTEAWQLTGRQRYRDVITETLAFVERELLNAQGGFLAALDADSEGVEGKYYVWSRQEVDQLLGEDADLFCLFFDITEGGNWEHTNIPWIRKELPVFAAELQLDETTVRELVKRGKAILLSARQQRIRPITDDKVLLGWNALMNAAFSKAYAATGERAYRQRAEANMEFLLKEFTNDGSLEFKHSWKENKARFPAFLDDYAYLIQALLLLTENSGDYKWLDKAVELANYVQDVFGEADTGFFFYTPEGQEDIIVRKKEVYDGATPSGNAIMAMNLHRLGVIGGGEGVASDWKARAHKLVKALGTAILKYPGSFGQWASLLMEICLETNEIVVTGENAAKLYQDVLALYIPHRVVMTPAEPPVPYAIVAGKPLDGKASIWLCRNNTCQPPVFSTKELISLINRLEKSN